MNFKNIMASIALAASLFVAPAGSNAQTNGGKELDAAIARMKVAPNQEEQVHTILVDGAVERVTILEKAGFERGKKPSIRQLMKIREPIQQSRLRTEQALAKILNKEQIAIYRQIAEENKAKMRARFTK